MPDPTDPAPAPGRRPRLSRALLADPDFRARTIAALPDPARLDRPVTAVQFGTGALLRGLVEPIVEAGHADASGDGGGRVAVVGSTGSGRAAALRDQDHLYTLVVQGLRDGEPVREARVIGAIARALSARDSWSDVLALARAPDLGLVFSNTTEVGIRLDPDDRPDADPPRSFPGKLTRFLLERGRACDFDPRAGLAVVPCELIENNGDTLRGLVLELADRWDLEPAFARWMDDAVPFADTLVDRIVPGAPADDAREGQETELGFRDPLLTVCEPYRLLAIQVDADARPRLARALGGPGVVLTDDITPFRERKVRLLNGTHTLMVPLALLCGHQAVREAMVDPDTGAFVRRLLLRELAPTLDVPGAEDFARDVLDRFANPFIRHALFDITLQSTTKMRVRAVPSLLAHAERNGDSPPSLAFGFAAFLLFQRGDLQDDRRHAGLSVPPDDAGEAIRRAWAEEPTPDDVVRRVLRDATLWGTDLTTVPGFEHAVRSGLEQLLRQGPSAALRSHLAAHPEG
ncbi:MAG: tagaturonate reductase [Gemmatimonadota bacterium]